MLYQCQRHIFHESICCPTPVSWKATVNHGFQHGYQFSVFRKIRQKRRQASVCKCFPTTREQNNDLCLFGSIHSLKIVSPCMKRQSLLFWFCSFRAVLMRRRGIRKEKRRNSRKAWNLGVYCRSSGSCSDADEEENTRWLCFEINWGMLKSYGH